MPPRPSLVAPLPPFDAELADALRAMGDLPRAGDFPDPVAVMRSAAASRPRPSDADLSCGGTFEVEQRTAPGPPGAPDVEVLVCRPRSSTPAGLLYQVHGGGLFSGDERSGITQALDIAAELSLVVVAVRYRLAPETPHPGPVEDCYAGLVWAAERAASLGTDPGRLFVLGASAGGGLGAATALVARDRGGPAIAGQMLLSPMLDDRNDSASARQSAGLGTWDSGWNAVGWAALLGAGAGGPDTSGYAAPARAGDLSGLPPTYLEVGSSEPLRDEVVEFAARLWQGGGQAELHVWPGAFHGFDVFSPGAALSAEARACRSQWVARQLR